MTMKWLTTLCSDARKLGVHDLRDLQPVVSCVLLLVLGQVYALCSKSLCGALPNARSEFSNDIICLLLFVMSFTLNIPLLI